MKIIFFSPHAGIWSHAFPEALIAESLKKRGHEIIYITCEQTFQGFCTVMSAFGVSNSASAVEKQKVCDKCKTFNKLILKHFSFDHLVLKDFLSSSAHQEIRSAISQMTPENLINFNMDGIEIGRLTLYQFLLEFKKSSLTFSNFEWQRVLFDLENALIAFYASKTLLLEQKPDAVIVYNSLYSVNHLFSKVADAYNIKQYFLHSGGNLATRLETMILAQGDGFKYYDHLISAWHDYKHIPCTEKLIKKVCAHLRQIVQGSSVFSYSPSVNASSVDIRKYFGAKSSQKIILATMSSNDERYAATIVKAYTQSEKVLFSDQFIWLKNLIDYIKDRSDLFLIIRVHPREVPNKRESVTSENYKKIIDLFKDLPQNVKINWPEENISLYYIAQEIDLCLNAWSSAGKELTAFGIPVLIYSSEIQVYPSDINYVGETKEVYFNLIDEILAKGWDFERIRKVIRWYAFEYFRTTLDLSDSLKMNEKLPFVYFQKFMRRLNSNYLQINNCKKRNAHLKEGSIINKIIEGKKSSILDLMKDIEFETTSVEEETDFLKKHLKQIFTILTRNNKRESLLEKNFLKFISSTESQYA